MKKLILVTLLITGCTPAPSRPYDPVRAQCEYEASIAIQNIQNPLYAGVRQSELIGMCMRAKGR